MDVVQNEGVGIVERSPMMEGRTMVMVLAPAKEAAPKKPAAPQPPAQAPAPPPAAAPPSAPPAA